MLLGKEFKLKVRLVCHKASDTQVEYRRRKANKLAKSRGYKSSMRNQQLLDWSIFVTNVPENKISANHLLLIYKIRWQIELLFKLYKSHMKIDTLKGKTKAYRVLCELYAKLCVALIFQGIAKLVPLKRNREISFTKAYLELKKRSNELFLAINSTKKLKNFLSRVIIIFEHVCLKDKQRKGRASSLNTLIALKIT